MNLKTLSNTTRSKLSAGAFTLVELLVAISIFAATVTVVYSTLYMGIKAYQRTQAELRRNKDIHQIAEKLSVELRNSMRPYALMFGEGENTQLGDEHSLSFITIHNAYTEAGMKKVMARMSYSFHDGTLFKKQQLDGAAFLDDDEFEEVALLANIESFNFNYLVRAGTEGESVTSWQPAWPCTDAMPRGIRMQVAWRDPATNTRTSLEQYIVIAQGELSCAEGGP